MLIFSLLLCRPRLGQAYKQIIAVGLSFFFFAAAYGVTHALGQVFQHDSGLVVCLCYMTLYCLDGKFRKEDRADDCHPARSA